MSSNSSKSDNNDESDSELPTAGFVSSSLKKQKRRVRRQPMPYKNKLIPVVRGLYDTVQSHSQKHVSKYETAQRKWKLILCAFLFLAAISGIGGALWTMDTVQGDARACQYMPVLVNGTATGIQLVTGAHALPLSQNTVAADEIIFESGGGCLLTSIAGLLCILMVPIVFQFTSAAWRAAMYSNTLEQVNLLTPADTNIKDMSVPQLIELYVDLRDVLATQNIAWLAGVNGEVTEMSKWTSKVPDVVELIRTATLPATRDISDSKEKETNTDASSLYTTLTPLEDVLICVDNGRETHKKSYRRWRKGGYILTASSLALVYLSQCCLFEAYAGNGGLTRGWPKMTMFLTMCVAVFVGALVALCFWPQFSSTAALYRQWVECTNRVKRLKADEEFTNCFEKSTRASMRRKLRVSKQRQELRDSDVVKDYNKISKKVLVL